MIVHGIRSRPRQGQRPSRYNTVPLLPVDLQLEILFSENMFATDSFMLRVRYVILYHAQVTQTVFELVTQSPNYLTKPTRPSAPLNGIRAQVHCSTHQPLT
ncbi:hypothetical protein TNCV_1728111 [Trichonephila clavipes]|nr:hypothetical protein TNCV_1728111 [Trichonephila clavipes]